MAHHVRVASQQNIEKNLNGMKINYLSLSMNSKDMLVSVMKFQFYSCAVFAFPTTTNTFCIADVMHRVQATNHLGFCFHMQQTK